MDDLYLPQRVRDALRIASLTITQDVKSSRILSGFQSLVPPNCIVIRQGEPTRVPSKDLVVGDVVSLQTGVRVPADMRCLTCKSQSQLKQLLFVLIWLAVLTISELDIF